MNEKEKMDAMLDRIFAYGSPKNVEPKKDIKIEKKKVIPKQKIKALSSEITL